MRRETAGVLIVAADGRTVFATGIATEPRVAAAVLRHWRERPEDARGLFAVEADGQALSIVAVYSDDATAFVAFARAASDVLFDFAATVEFADDIL
ncbi:MAG: hypothetical protein ACLGHK_06770, partial [Alphaproteobacteria bacterium]